MAKLIRLIIDTVAFAIAIRSIRTLVTCRISGRPRANKTCRVIRSVLQGEVSLGQGAVVSGAGISGAVEIGDYTYLSGPGIHLLSALKPIKIGKFCSIARGVQMQEFNHRTDGLTTSFVRAKLNGGARSIDTKGAIAVGHDVWIGTNAIITSGVNIGTGAIIGAGAVVTHDVPPYAVVVGVPARVVKYRFHESKIKDLLESKWWDLPLEEVVALADRNYE